MDFVCWNSCGVQNFTIRVGKLENTLFLDGEYDGYDGYNGLVQFVLEALKTSTNLALRSNTPE